MIGGNIEWYTKSEMNDLYVYTRNVVSTTFLTTLLQQILSIKNICIRICILVIKCSTESKSLLCYFIKYQTRSNLVG